MKSFSLINDNGLKSAKAFNGNRWMHRFGKRAHICWALMLIAASIGFSEQANSQKTMLKISQMHEKLTEDPKNRNDDFLMKILTTRHNEKFLEALQETELETLDSGEPLSESIADFNGSSDLKEASFEPDTRFYDICNEKTICTLICSIFHEEDLLNSRLEIQQRKCKKDMELTIQASIFSRNKLSKKFLSGNFRLKSLTLYHNILYEIDDNAFKKPALKNLQKLIITNASITRMNSQTFAGLEAIKYFEMTNQESLTELNAKQFLKPISETLTQLIFVQSSVMKAYDTTPWFNGADFKRLADVDLNGNYFRDALHADSFAALVAVESLKLGNCRISYFGENTFSKVIDTLRYLDLSRNYLNTLSAEFLLSISGTSASVSLAANNWDCSCDNHEFIGAIKNSEINFVQEPKCSSPYEVYGEEIKNVNGVCPSETTTTPTTETEVTETVTSSETEDCK